jgi:hypothetical protein
MRRTNAGISAIVRAAAIAVACCVGGSAVAQDNAYLAPTSSLARYKNIPHPQNGQGSCVQASLSMVGLHQNVPAAECLLRSDPEYGPPELGGSYPSRVAAYAARRGMAIYNVEGSDTLQWIDWALRNGRYAAITYGRAHMIIATGMTPDGSRYQIVDNNYPTEPRWVSRDVFVREHRGYAGGWTVILDTPAPLPWIAPAAAIAPEVDPRGPSPELPEWLLPAAAAIAAAWLLLGAGPANHANKPLVKPA